MLTQENLINAGKASIYLGIPLVAYSHAATLLLPLTLKKYIFQNSSPANHTSFPTLELTEYCTTPNTYNTYGYALGSLAFFASAAFSSNMLYSCLNKTHSAKAQPHLKWTAAALLIPCISSGQLNAYNFANSFILLSSGCENTRTFTPTLAFYALTLLALSCPAIGNFIFLESSFNQEKEDCMLIKSVFFPNPNNRHLKAKLLDTKPIAKRHITNTIDFLSTYEVAQLDLTDVQQLKAALERHQKSAICKLLFTQSLTMACLYPCYQSSMNFFEYSKITTQLVIQDLSITSPQYAFIPLSFAIMSLIINTVIAAVCLKNSIIKPLLRKPQCNQRNLMISLAILIPSVSMSAPTAMLTAIDNSLSDQEKITIGSFGALLTLTFALPGLQNLANSLCFNQTDNRKQTTQRVHRLLEL